jgi:3-isopropylmalate dehydrogenase
VIGVFPGEGVGPEVIRAALGVLDAVESIGTVRIERIEMPTAATIDHVEGKMPEDVSAFCEEVFSRDGAMLCGPGGGRFVYDMRRRFDLFCKLAPLRPLPSLHNATRLKPHVVRDVDIVVVRDNAGGVYQGQWSERIEPGTGRVAEHSFAYNEKQVERILGVGLRLAKTRRGRMHVVVKEGGVPTVSALWCDVARALAADSGVECIPMNADHAAYRIIQHPGEFDVMVTPNLLGDLLADIGAVLLGSRGMSFSANFSANGRAVYQTGHGGAKDLAMTDRANPLAQILSLAMLLRESFGMEEEASLVEQAVGAVLSEGWRTEDLAEMGSRCVGTQQMGTLVAESVLNLSGSIVAA